MQNGEGTDNVVVMTYYYSAWSSFDGNSIPKHSTINILDTILHFASAPGFSGAELGLTTPNQPPTQKFFQW